MVTFKTRAYKVEEDDVIGAEVIVYSDEGEKISEILITSPEEFEELKRQLYNLDVKYVQISELSEELSKITVNADTLNDLTKDDFAKVNHEHGNQYAQKNHAAITNDYGLGSNTNYGHNKIINNLNSEVYAEGESLAAYQGKVLKDSVNELRSGIRTWQRRKLNSYLTLYYNNFLRLAFLQYYRLQYTVSGDTTLHSDVIPSAYKPVQLMYSPSSTKILLGIDTNGDVILKYNGATAETTTLSGWWIYIF